jgi:aspartate carbamoyltransferase catalytic subunit
MPFSTFTREEHEMLFRHVGYARDFDKSLQQRIFKRARMMREYSATEAGRESLRKILPLKNKRNHVLMFKGQSTRTASTFIASILNLGGNAVPLGWDASSMVKGEMVPAMVRTLYAAGYSSLIIRYDDNDRDVIAEAISTCEEFGLDFFIVNAGLANREHPTQMLLDIFTAEERFREKLLGENLRIICAGDLAYSRTIQSLAVGLQEYKPKISFVSQPEILIPKWVKKELNAANIHFSEIHEPLENIIGDLKADICYMTRLQTNLRKDWGRNPAADEKLQRDFLLYSGMTGKTAAKAPATTLFMHPKPSGPEWPEWFEKDPRNISVEQIVNGLHIRKALYYERFAGDDDIEIELGRIMPVTFHSAGGDVVATTAAEIRAICSHDTCAAVKLRQSDEWGKIKPAERALLRHKPFMFCPEHRPTLPTK